MLLLQRAIFSVSGPAVSAFGLRHCEYVSSRRYPSWGVARVVGVKDGRLWLHFQGDVGATTREDHWHFADLQLIRSWHDPSLVGLEKSAFRLPLEDGTRVVRGPHVSDHIHTQYEITTALSATGDSHDDVL